MEERKGKYPPLILNDKAILYPEGSTTLNIGKFGTFSQQSPIRFFLEKCP